MSKKALQETLTKILAEIKQNSETYRKLVSDKIAHEIIINASEIKKEVKKELAAAFGFDFQKDIPKNIISAVNSGVDEMCQTLYKSFTPDIFFMTSSTDVFELGQINGTPKNFSVVLAPAKNKSPSIFRKIRKIKKDAQEILVVKINTEIDIANKNKSKNNKLQKIDSSKFLDIGHAEGAAVSRQRKKIAENLLYAFAKENKSSTNATNFLNLISKELSLSIKKDPGVPKSVISVYFESSRLNQLRGATTEKQFASITGSLTRDLEIVLNRLGPEKWVNQEGSSSQLQLIEAEVLNPLADTKGKNIRNKIKRKKVKLNTSTATIKDKKSKIQKVSSGKIEGSKLKVIEQSTASFPLELLTILNKRLPDTVMKNMEFPALENRTGRFANSVKAVNIVSTTKGFPSIEYTYQLNPYQTFEPGGPMGSLERDPKRLIDRSIREIASEYAMMRFYTRRR